MAKIAPKGKKVTGTKKKDKITWTSSKPWNRALTVNAGKGNDVINFKKSKFKNTLNGQDGNDKIYGGKNIDKINGGNGNDKLYGYAGNDIIKGGKGNDYIDGGAGNDKIYGQYNTNKLKGGAGNDKIYGGTGTDHIWGGKNNDIINAGKGSNIIYFANGDGTDTIVNGGGSDTLKFTNITSITSLQDQLSAIKEGNNLVLYYGSSESDRVIVSNYFTTASSVKTLMANDGKTISVEELLNSKSFFISGEGTITGSKYNDNIYGSSGDDEIFAGLGNDTINASGGNNTIHITGGNDVIQNTGTGYDTIKFDNLTSFDEITKTINANGDLVISYANGTVTFEGYGIGNHDNSAVVIGNNSINIPDIMNSTEPEIQGTDSNDIINATSLTTDIYAGSGDDTINLANSNGVTVHLKSGEGKNTIQNLKSNDVLYFENAFSAAVQVNYDPETKNLELYDINNNDKFVIEDYMNSSKDGMIQFASGTEKQISEYLQKCGINGHYGLAIGGDGADTITGKYGDIYAGGGNDVIYGGTVDRAIYAHGGAGNDTITGGSDNTNVLYGEAGEDVIIAGAGATTEIYGGADNDILQRGESTGQISYHFNSAGGDGNDTITDNLSEKSYIYFDEADNTFKNNIDYKIVKDALVIQYTENDSVVVNDYAKSNNKDNLKINGGLTLETNLYNSGKALIYEGDESSNTITVKDINVKSEVNAGAGDDIITVNIASDVTIKGGAGADNISGGSGNAVINGDDGNDIIVGSSGTYNSKLYGGTGEDDITAGAGYSTIVGGADNDTLKRGNSESYVYYEFNMAGDGDDTIIDNLTGTSRISFTGLNDDEEYENFLKTIEYEVVGDDLVMKYGTDSSITVQGFMTSENQNNLNIYNPYNSTGLPVTSQISSITIKGDDNANTITPKLNVETHIYGNVGEDNITVGSITRDTTINGGADNDILQKGTDYNGTLSYEFSSSGDGHDTIIDDLNNSSYIKFTGLTDETEDAFYNSLGYSADGEDLIITYGENSSIRVKDFLTNANNTKLYIVKNDNDTLGVKYMLDQEGYVINGTDGDDTLSGVDSSKYTVNGKGGNDVITGGSYSGTLNGNDGNDTIYSGNATLVSIMGGAGDDILYRSESSGAQINYIFNQTGDGNDVIYDNTTQSDSEWNSRIRFKGEEGSDEDAFWNTDNIKASVNFNDLVLAYGTENDSTIIIKNGMLNRKFWHCTINNSVAGIGYHDILSNIKSGDNTDETIQYTSDHKYIWAGAGNDTITTMDDGAVAVFGASGNNTINTKGNDTIGVESGANDTINIVANNNEREILLQNGSKATVNGIIYGTTNFVFTDKSFDEIMVYGDTNGSDNELHIVTRNFETDVTLNNIYSDIANGQLQVLTGDVSVLSRFNVTDNTGESRAINHELFRNYFDMEHLGVHSFASSGAFDEQYDTNGENIIANGMSNNWLIDGTEGDDEYYTIIQGSGVIDIYDKGGNDAIHFDNPFYSGNNSTIGGINTHGYTTFFDVKITADEEWNITSQSFGEDLYFSGSMTDFFNSGFKTAYTCIHDYFDSTKENNQGIGFIEEITDDENKTVNMGQLEALRNDVAGWLATNHYTSVSDVVNDTERECNLSDLIAIYTSKQPYVG